MATNALLRRYYAMSFVGNLSFALPIWVVFGHDYLHLSYLQAMALSVLPDLIGAVLTVPMGAVADRYGRRLIYQIGLLLSLVGPLSFVVSRDFFVLFAAVPITGVGIALAHGSVDAIVSAALHDRNRDYMLATSNQRTALFAGRILGSTIGAALYAWHPTLPFVAMSLEILACLVLSKGLPTTQERHAESTVQLLADTAREFIKRRDLGVVFLFALVASLAGNMVYTAYQPLLQRAGFADKALGVLFAFTSVCSIIGARISRLLINYWRVRTIVCIQLLGTMCTALLLTVATGLWAVVATVPLQIIFGTATPVANTYVAARTPLRAQATALSLVGFAMQGWTLAALFTGTLLDAYGPRSVCIVAACATGMAILAIPRRMLDQFVITPTNDAADEVAVAVKQ